MAVATHQVAGAEPGIPLGENIAQNFLFGFGLLGIALEIAASALGDAANGFAHLTRLAFDTKTVLAAHRHFAFDIKPHHPGRQ